MPYTVKVEQANLAPGTPVFIGHLGEVKNGEDFVVSDIEALTFEVLSGKTLMSLDDAEGFTVSKFEEKQEEPEEPPKVEGVRATPKARTSKGGDK